MAEDVPGLLAEVDRLRAELAAATARAEALRCAALVPMWGRWSVRLGPIDPVNAWATEAEALAYLDRHLEALALGGGL